MSSSQNDQINMVNDIEVESPTKLNPELAVYEEQNKVKCSLLKKSDKQKPTFTLRQYLRLNQMFSKTKNPRTEKIDKKQKMSRKAAILMMKRENQKQFQLAIKKLKKCHEQINRRLQLDESDADLHFLSNIQKIIHENILNNVQEIEKQLSMKMNINFQVESERNMQTIQSAVHLNRKHMQTEE